MTVKVVLVLALIFKFGKPLKWSSGSFLKPWSEYSLSKSSFSLLSFSCFVSSCSDDLFMLALFLILAWKRISSDKIFEHRIWNIVSPFLLSTMWISFFYMKSFASTLQSHGRPNNKLRLQLLLGVTNVQISYCIPETLIQNWTQHLNSIESPLATDILRRWGAKVFAGRNLTPNRLTNHGLMIIKFEPWSTLIWESGRAYFVFISDVQIVAFMWNAFVLDCKILASSCSSIWRSTWFVSISLSGWWIFA